MRFLITRQILLLSCMASLVLSSEPVTARSSAAEEWKMPESWTRPVEPFAIAEDLYYVGTEQLAAYLFVTDAGHVLLDAPLQQNVARVLASIRMLGFSPQDVRYLIASHGHYDHVGGLASMQEATGAEIVVSSAAAELVRVGGRGDFFWGDALVYRRAKVQRVIEDGGVLRLGSLELSAHLTPGHTKGCTSWSAQVVVAGQPRQMVVVCSLSVLDGYQLVGEGSSYPGIGADFCGSVETLRELDAEVFLASHPSFFGMRRKASKTPADPAAFVDPAGLNRYLDDSLSKIEATLEKQGAPEGCSKSGLEVSGGASSLRVVPATRKGRNSFAGYF